MSLHSRKNYSHQRDVQNHTSLFNNVVDDQNELINVLTVSATIKEGYFTTNDFASTSYKLYR